MPTFIEKIRYYRVVRKIVVFLSVFMLSFTGRAAHIVGGDMYYDYLGGNNYRIYIAIYRDCASTGAEFDNPMSLGVFNSSNQQVQQVNVSFPGSTNLPVIFDNPCVTAPSGICVERAIYTAVINLPPSAGGYTIAYQRCCRGPNVTNLDNPEDTGLTLTCHVTGTTSGAIINSSPRYVNYPPLVICNNQDLIFDHSATDPDGDVLTYELVTPFAGASSGDPQPSVPPPPNYFLVDWAGGIGATNPLGPGSVTTINPNTGELFVDANQLGLYVVGIRVNEYRAGVWISSTTRDFLFRVVNCVIQLEAIVPEQTIFCQGFTISFDNQSYGGQMYSWDFGVPGITTDESSQFNPTYTFPDAGIYQVELIVNEGWPCSDTIVVEYKIDNNLQVDFQVADSICITGNSFDFDGSFTGPTGATFLWEFGPHASIDSSTNLDVNGVVFDTSGFIPIVLSGEFEECFDQKIDSIFIYRTPTIDFYVPQGLQCVPYTAYFTDSSMSDSPLLYFWEFGDGETSTQQHPSHVYTYVDTFDVRLTIMSTEGCIDTLTLLEEDIIAVTPTPISQFSVTPTITDIFHSTITFSDESFDSDAHYYWFNDTLVTPDRFTTHTYIEGGYHTAFQVVVNEFGCRDTSYQTIYIIPETTIYTPNSFTPDGDDYNNSWYPVVYDVSEWELWIYDRWGEIIFHTTEQRKGWNGTLNGSDSPDGTYIYKYRYRDIQTGIASEFLGHLNLLR